MFTLGKGDIVVDLHANKGERLANIADEVLKVGFDPKDIGNIVTSWKKNYTVFKSKFSLNKWEESFGGRKASAIFASFSDDLLTLRQILEKHGFIVLND